MRSVLRLWPLWSIIALVLLFRLAPGIDLQFSRLFFSPAQGFFLHDALPVRLNYWLFRYLPYVAAPLLLWLLFASWRWGGRPERPLRRSILFLCVTLLLGPGILVNEVLKRESGRARPVAVQQFGGDKTFTPALVIADQCRSNCSFVSGHAAMGFFFMSLAWVLHNRRWLLYGGLIGAAAGLGRIAEGAHFLSDVVFSLVAVYLTALLCARWLLGRWSAEPA
jgi:lipid A 4'-phosphatase